jgi:ankyrin repeat protein
MSSANLSAAYDITLQRIQNQGRKGDQGLEILAWMLYAKRPLSLLELRQALSIELDPQYDEDFDAENIPEDDCINSCLGLVKLDPITRNLQLMHLSLLDYFESPETQTRTALLLPWAKVLAEKCVTYLLYRQTRERLDSAVDWTTIQSWIQEHKTPLAERYAFLPYVARYWGEHVLDDGSGAGVQIDGGLGSSGSLLNKKIERLALVEAAEMERASIAFHSEFLASPWQKARMWRLCRVELSDSSVQAGQACVHMIVQHHLAFFGLRTLWINCKPSSTAREQTKHDWNPHADGGGYLRYHRPKDDSILNLPLNAVGYATIGDRPEMVELLLAGYNAEEEEDCSLGCSQWVKFALMWRPLCAEAILSSRHRIGDFEIPYRFWDWNWDKLIPAERILLKLVKHPGFPTAKLSEMALLAAKNGHLELLSWLLRSDEVDINILGAYPFETTIHLALQANREEAVLMLLRDGRLSRGRPRHKGNGYWQDSASLINLTYFKEMNRALEFLLESRTDFDVNGPDGLQAAIAHGQERKVRLFLACSRTNPNAKYDGTTALHMAVAKRSLPIIEALLSHPQTDPNTQQHEGQTPLHVAIASHLDETSYLIVQQLLKDPRTESTVPDDGGKTALDCVQAQSPMPEAGERIIGLLEAHMRTSKARADKADESIQS